MRRGTAPFLPFLPQSPRPVAHPWGRARSPLANLMQAGVTPDGSAGGHRSYAQHDFIDFMPPGLRWPAANQSFSVSGA